MIVKSFRDIDGSFLPFPRLEPENLFSREISLRPEGKKWTTLHFIIEYSGARYRVKEFFLDWFFLGFPKSLMRDFANTYSKIEDAEINGYDVFLGRDYKDLPSLSAFVHGTQVEIETISGEQGKLMDVFADLRVNISDLERLRKMQFTDRSFLARGGNDHWFEGKRISRMKWQRSQKMAINLNDTVMNGSGIGILLQDSLMHRIMILENGDFSRCVWIEMVDRRIGIEHPFYVLRKGDYLFNTFKEAKSQDDFTIMGRIGHGPWVAQKTSFSEVVTIAFSPGFNEDDVLEMTSRSGEIIPLIYESSLSSKA